MLWPLLSAGLHDSAKMMLEVKYFSNIPLSNAEQRERELINNPVRVNNIMRDISFN